MLATDLVADGTGRHDTTAERDSVGVDDPAQGGVVTAQVASNGRRRYRRASEYQGDDDRGHADRRKHLVSDVNRDQFPLGTSAALLPSTQRFAPSVEPSWLP